MCHEDKRNEYLCLLIEYYFKYEKVSGIYIIKKLKFTFDVRYIPS
jgi:hypothetical protein